MLRLGKLDDTISEEIRRTYQPNPVFACSFSPEAKGKPPQCRCEWCNRGEIKARRLIQVE